MLRGGGGGGIYREGDRGVRHVLGPIFWKFLSSQRRFSDFVSPQGPILKSRSIPGDNVFICSIQGH